MRPLILYTTAVLLSLTEALNVYLYPNINTPNSNALPQALPPAHASAVISHHLGLELFDSHPRDAAADFKYYTGYEYGVAQSFVGQGLKNAVLLSVAVDDDDVVPEEFKPTFTLDPNPEVSSLDSILSTFLHRARHVYSHIHTASFPSSSSSDSPSPPPRQLDLFTLQSHPSTNQFLTELAALSAFLDDASTSESEDVFAAFEVKSLPLIRRAFGAASDEYRVAVAAVRAALRSAVAKHETPLQVALLTYTPPASSFSKRQSDVADTDTDNTDFEDNSNADTNAPPQVPLPVPAPQQPIGSVSTCFLDVDSCGNGTSACSGHGACVRASKAGRTCFVCACTKGAGWAGERCERKDISGPFTLITGTVIGLVLLMGGAVSLLYGVGGEALPSTLTGGIGAGARRE